MVPDQRIDDGSGGDDEGGAVEPGIVMIASGRQPAALVLPPAAELGRRIVAGTRSHEVADERMSRDHAVVVWQRDGWVIRDLDSRNGTFVDGERISGEVRRRGNAILRLGHTMFALLADVRDHPAPDGYGEVVIGPELARVYEQIRRHAGGDVLLVHGEPGSGKEVAARRFHEVGPRRAGLFVAVNCATIPESVAERLLFGGKKSEPSGAFAGAIEAVGHFQMASGGTLFLDEIAALDLAVQARLLRVLEKGEVMPVGAATGTPIEIGIVAGTHRELHTAVADQRLRDDLYHRLARASVHLPPLRERRVDIARIVQREVVAVGSSLAPHAKLIEACLLRPWPGNVRELRAAIRRAATAVLADGRDVVRVEDLELGAGAPAGPVTGETAVERRKTLQGEIDREAVIAALGRANGVVSVAARNLGLHRSQLHRLMEKLGIVREDP